MLNYNQKNELFKETTHPYSFKYLQTAIKGEGIPCVYLPKIPDHTQILDFGGLWEKQPLPEQWDEWKDKETYENAVIKKFNEQQKQRVEQGL